MKATVIGAGLAGSEAAYQLAEAGVRVKLIEQKPKKRTAAAQHDFFAELVCSNSFRGAALTSAVGLLKEEMARSGSFIMACAQGARVPAGGAFAVDREIFGRAVTEGLHGHANIEVVCEEVRALPEASPRAPVVLATGPLTGDALAADLAAAIGQEHLAYYDAIAPVVSADSINWDVVFKASRYDKGDDAAYGNCPMNEEEYARFLNAVLEAEKVVPREFEEVRYFEGCLPVEVMAERGPETLRYGPMKPVGLRDPRTGHRPHAVVQLRQENAAASAYNLVGFQTRMKHGEQKRVIRMIPGLENAEFERLGSVHRNTFVNAPEVTGPLVELKARPGVHLAGQVSGVEGYIESAACGLLVGQLLGARLAGTPITPPPPTTALGGLYRYLGTAREDFQPSNVTWNMIDDDLPRVETTAKGKRRKIGKRERREKLSERALAHLAEWRAPKGEALASPPPA
ncbi:MAG: methylenetetrahydrofolate--tRNA-(uracil(54)-C(5))-methyltransferase (FADH(2)-oxidizing) TrmFO [Myxococcota bacterium]